jgi:uncharacterized protein YkwD
VCYPARSGHSSGVPTVACDRASNRSVIPVRVVLVAVLSVFCLCVGAQTSPALGQPVARANGHGRAGNRRGVRRRVPARRTPAAAKSGACADADLMPNEEDVARVGAAVLCLVNRERVDDGEGPLEPNARLETAAQGHSEEMSVGDYFDHVGARGDTPLSRMRACGYIYSSQIGYEIGENLGLGILWLATPRAIVSAWMASPGHRGNILDPRYRDTAIGVAPQPPASLAHGEAGAVYTQDFGAMVTG